MPVYRRKPQEIVAEPGGIFIGAHIRGRLKDLDFIERFGEVTIRKTDEGDYEIYNWLHASWIKFGPDNMIRVDASPDDVYPIEWEYFKKNFELKMEGSDE